MMTTHKLTISAMVVALYIVLIYVTQGISFGAYQIRIATSLYALAYAFPFLIIPMGVGNLISNFFGGLGILDMVGGFGVGVLTTAIIVLMRRMGLSAWWVALPIIFVPALCVPLWLSPLIGVPYWALVLNLAVGQTIPGIVGAILVKALSGRRSIATLMGTMK